jgi:hypothetical protein
VPYQFTDQGLAMQDEITRFMDDHIYPNEEAYYFELGPAGYPPVMRQVEGGRQGAASVESVPAPSRAGRARDEVVQSRLRPGVGGVG